MFILVISFVVCILFVAAAVALIVTRQPKKEGGELLRLTETYVTGVMGAMMIALAFFLLYMKYVDPAIAGVDQVSFYYVAGFAAMCAAVGSGIQLYTFLRKIIAYEDKVVFVTMLGQIKELYWNDITEVKVSRLSNKAIFIGKNTQFSVGGETKTYKKFIEIARKKIRKTVGSEVFEKLFNRFMF
ncbi:MAG: hypothetical protein EHM41_05955 [Chloroflexi bacterium]|nr:MAG: hypothetical protein EHM41_05955 [Chloroflexota bacterium]